MLSLQSCTSCVFSIVRFGGAEPKHGSLNGRPRQMTNDGVKKTIEKIKGFY